LTSLLALTTLLGFQFGPVATTQPVLPNQVVKAYAAKPGKKLNPLRLFRGKKVRPLGILGVNSIPKKNFKLADFKGHLAGPGLTLADPTLKNNRIAGATALVLYDSSGTFGWIGALYAYQLSNLLSHFGVTVLREGVENYKTGQLSSYGSAYYLGTQYANTLPQSFLNDVVIDKKPFVWMGYNLWEVAWTPDMTNWNSAFTNRFGFNFDSVDSTGYPTVQYKGSTLSKQLNDPTQGNTVINDPTIASVLATSTNGTATVPYITYGNNFWYVADNPMEYIAYNRGDDRLFAFADILNDSTQYVPTTQQRAVLRIEDVSASCDSASLRGIADLLYTEGVPYVVCVIPNYKDPLGVFNSGVPVDIQMQNSATFMADLQYMQSKGAQLIMHGVTHQYGSVANPANGVSAADVEFFRVTTDTNGNQVVVGPVPEDSTTWATDRINTGFTMWSGAGFTKPTGWNSPHYFATPTDYKVFAKNFKYCLDRVLTFATDQSGNLQYLVQYSPYVYNDEYNCHRIPETIGYYDPNASSGRVNLPTDMINYAQQIQCVRGGWAGMYYHWFLGTAGLQQLVEGIKGLGYTFVDPSKAIN